jgi:hypothetical protein
MKKFLFVAVLICFGVFLVNAQTVTDDEDIQSWNDLQITSQISKKIDFYTVLTTRFGKNVTRFTEGRYGIGIIYKPNKAWSIQSFYLYINARNTRGIFQHEDRLNLRVGYQFPFKSFGLSHRSMIEYRIRQPRHSFRYRPALTLDRDIPKNLIANAKFYLTEEVFYDSILKKFSRNRFSAGITKTLSKKLSFDLYYMRQNDGYSQPGDLNVIGTNFKIKL